MKKLVFLGALLFTACCVFAVEAEIVSVEGKVEIKSQGRAWHTAAKGEKINAGSVISTGFKSTVTFKIDGSTFVVNPLTRLKLEEIMQKDNAVSSKVFLDTGSMKADVKPKTTEKVNFQVQTPVATASVRGTAGEITAAGTLVSSQGVWEYKSGSIVAYIPKGSLIEVTADGNIASAATVLEKAARVSNIADAILPSVASEPTVASSPVLTIDW